MTERPRQSLPEESAFCPAQFFSDEVLAMFADVERLEPRRLLTATASLSNNGTLLISGDGGDDLVLVHGTGAGSVDVVLNAYGTTPLPFSGVTNILIRTRGGDDLVEVYDVNIGGDLQYNTGAGIDHLVLAGTESGTFIAGNVSIQTGAGDDQMFLGAGMVDIGGNLTANFGRGNDITQFIETTVHGSTTLRGGAGSLDELLDGASTNILTVPQKVRGFEIVTVF